MSERKQEAADWSVGACRANGVDIQYRRSGGNKPPLVALHGLIGSGACLTPMARPLTSCFDVVLPDARGHGGSSAPEQGYRYSDLAADLRGLIEGLGLQSPVLVGHSMGGMTAAVVASALGLRVNAVVLIDPTFISPARQREVYESDVATEHQQMLDLTRESLLTRARLSRPDRSTEIHEYVVDARLQTSLRAFEVLAPPNPDWRELAKSIRVPTLLVTGDRGVVSIETARELQDLNPLIHHRHMTGGHGLPYDEPERLGASVQAFLAQTTAVGTGAGPPRMRRAELCDSIS